MSAADTMIDAPPERARKGRTARQSEARIAWLLMLPGIVLLLLFVVLPFVLAAIFSVTNQRLISPLPTRFVGIENYVDEFTNPLFWKSLRVTVVFAVALVPLLYGAGLGLAISRDLIRAHGGTIEIDSSPGAGTTLTIQLPLDAE